MSYLGDPLQDLVRLCGYYGFAPPYVLTPGLPWDASGFAGSSPTVNLSAAIRKEAERAKAIEASRRAGRKLRIPGASPLSHWIDLP